MSVAIRQAAVRSVMKARPMTISRIHTSTNIFHCAFQFLVIWIDHSTRNTFYLSQLPWSPRSAQLTHLIVFTDLIIGLSNVLRRLPLFQLSLLNWLLVLAPSPTSCLVSFFLFIFTLVNAVLKIMIRVPRSFSGLHLLIRWLSCVHHRFRCLHNWWVNYLLI